MTILKIAFFQQHPKSYICSNNNAIFYHLYFYREAQPTIFVKANFYFLLPQRIQ